MKWRLTGEYLVSAVIIVILVIFINVFMIFSLLIIQARFDIPIFQDSEISAEQFTREFQTHLAVENHDVQIDQDGKKELIDQNAWIQVLDENGQVITGYREPKSLPQRYTPADIIQHYKYKEVDAETTVFVGEKDGYSYLMGIENPNINRFVLTSDIRNIFQAIKVFLGILVIDIIIALLIGYVFSTRLTKPINRVIDGIKQLANKDYSIDYQPNGVYKKVFHNMNNLSKQLKENEREREKTEQMREEWLANISHDIKTPLSSIKGYAELMTDPDYNISLEEMCEYAEIIEKKSVYIKDVMDDLHLTTKLKNNTLILNKQETNMVELLRNCVIDILNDPQYVDAHIEFDAIQEQIPMKVDQTLMKRAINNLIYNALVHNTKEVNIDVSIKVDEKHLTIQIKDDGKGIEQAEVDKIFDRYYRGTNTGERHKGSGLGMAIAKDVIKEHQGEITVASEVGKGTEITVTLKLKM
ncbi:HAMP domain-containing sensor histidine kinase [Gracilibacillus sp. S3-1-1]|uniref:HAMP domain-containing sensor histidine kinase n=1 Tax=Gracilibacillus pellucidus TaxID=3095368 RepID=A0ACC6M215_9BACI|nr:HAMP domain-containing sensor histidine kinase [Gracilibacillus sp. S3-1-1]MDX8044985.1 HAMP domain-containing sensor histidine kinase [Gracilibacillus sp. S3-1-1]